MSEDLRQKLTYHWGRVRSDPMRLAISLSVVIVVIGFAGVLRPLQGNIEHSRDLIEEATGLARKVETITELAQQQSFYHDRLQVPSDLVHWQDYVLVAMEEAGCTLVKMEKGDVKRAQDFRIIELDVSLEGSYDQVRDFVDRLERGHRLVRLDQLILEPTGDDSVSLRTKIRGLAAARLEQKSKGEGDA